MVSKQGEPKTQIVEIPHNISVRQLADLLQVGAVDIIKQLMRSGIFANINQIIAYEAADAVAKALGFETKLKLQTALGASKRYRPKAADAGNLKPRPPVVTIMGHVDHGKTKLLDAIRQTNVMESEAGGITQHIGAYQVEFKGQKLTFLDTPGHEAFTAMRAHGAQVTDITVLVVAADDGVMPQTREAIDHARAAGVPIVVAINKIDKPEANPDLVKRQLADLGLVIEEWGGEVVSVPISAKKKIGIDDLLENILAVTEMEDLKADPTQPPVGVVIEATLDKTRGPMATVLIQNGTLKTSDMVVVGTVWGRIRAMMNDNGKRIRKAEPATPVEIIGLSGVPQAGDILNMVANEHQAKEVIAKKLREIQQLNKAVSLDSLFDQISAGTVKELNVILKADVQGSIEPIRNSLERLSNDKVKVRILHSGTGNITESDVTLAVASQGLVIGFNNSVDAGARRLADLEGVDIRTYEVIYSLLDDVDKALKGLLEPRSVEVIEGRAEVRAIFTSGKKERVAGVVITEGTATRGALVRVRRGAEVLLESETTSLRRFKENVNEVATGLECGVGVKDFEDFRPGDILEFFKREKTKRQ
jgi:translation initiation factor IF-2